MENSEKKTIDTKLLLELKEVMDDKDDSFIEKIAQKVVGFFGDENTTKEEKRKNIISAVVKNEASLDVPALKSAMRKIAELQKTKTTDAIISKVSDIKSSQNHGDFISFVQEEGKKYYVVGDLHDDMTTFDQILKAIKFENEFDAINLVFLGDYVDRGKDRLTLINKIIFLKYLLPNNIHLLRGNHELYTKDEKGDYYSPIMDATPNGYHFDLLTFLVNTEDEKHKAIKEKNGIDKELIELYAEFFDSMATVALFHFHNIKICATHGGLPRPNLNAQDYFEGEEFSSFNKLLDVTTKDSVGIAQKTNMLWSDPCNGYKEGFRNTSKVRFHFSKDQFVHFCKKYDIDMMLRAHEEQENGYKSYFDDRLISVFSSGGRSRNEPDVVNPNSYYLAVSPNILKITENELVSLNIDFQKEIPNSVEERFENKAIIFKRQEHEKELHLSQKSKISDVELFKNITKAEGVIQIVDANDVTNKRTEISKGEKVKFNHKNLEAFTGIHKDIYFEIDPTNMSITNLSDVKLTLGEYGAVLHKDQSVGISRNFIVKIGENGGRLAFVV